MLHLFSLCRRTVGVAALVLTIQLIGQRILGEDGTDQAELDAIVAAWEERERTLGKIRMEWTQEDMWSRGGLQPKMPGNDRIEEIPDRDTTCNMAFKLSLNGDHIRWEFSGDQPSGRGLIEYPGRVDRVEGYDGVESRYYFTSGQPMGEIRETIREHPFKHISLAGVRYALGRVFVPEAPRVSSSRTAGLQIVSRDAIKGNLRCVVVRHDVPDLGRQKVARYSDIWVDVSREFLVVRVMDYVNRNLKRQHDIAYARIDGEMWFPNEWRGTTYEGGGTTKPIVSYVASLTTHEINPHFGDAEFRPEFPSGTYVTDHVRGQKYIQRDGNVKRIITESEQQSRARYEDLLNTESGDAGRGPDHRRKRVRWVLWGNAAIVAMLALGVWRWQSHRGGRA